MRYVIGLMAAIWCALAVPAQAQGEKRAALVIGNAAYRTVGELPNPRKDARDVAAALRGAGFAEVVELYNLGIQQMRERQYKGTPAGECVAAWRSLRRRRGHVAAKTVIEPAKPSRSTAARGSGPGLTATAPMSQPGGSGDDGSAALSQTAVSLDRTTVAVTGYREEQPARHRR
jgi:hypothetical protein